MANTVCHDGYEPTLNKGNNQTTIFGENIFIVGYVLFGIAFGALLWYGASIGIYIDSALV